MRMLKMLTRDHVVPGSDIKRRKTMDEDESQPALATTVVLLQNMVGRGQVDSELEAETAEECSKYGRVVECVIFEFTDPAVPDTDAVRIFIHFERLASARAAVTEMNGRLFDGRKVRATFFNENKFAERQLV
jgi:splicing factor 45